MKLGEKTRGYSTFTTNLDLSDAIELTPADDWISAIQDATPGSKFALAPGEYVLTAAKLQINNNVVIAAKNSAEPPVINTCIHIYNGASLYLYQVVLDERILMAVRLLNTKRKEDSVTLPLTGVK